MITRLPSTPLDALNISPVLGAVVKTIHFFADIFGFWRSPSEKAAADFEDMSLLDKIYWGYKSKKPVRRSHKNLNKRSMSGHRNIAIEPPTGFEEKQTLTFAAVGDLIKVEGLEHSQDLLYKDIEDLVFSRDVIYGNLESQLTRQELSSYTFSDKEAPPLCCSMDQYQALRRHNGRSLDLFHTATNHTMDMGTEGFDTTLEQLAADGILDLGTNRTPDERSRCRVLEKNGLKLGFVSATYGLNGKPLPEGRDYAVNVVKFHPGGERTKPGELTLLLEQIDDCRENKCDFIIASLHWGYEYEFFPRPHQQEMAHQLAELGVDLIVAHHPHVIQPLELYRPERDPSRVVPIAYSLGNLTSSFSAPHLVLSGVLNVVIAKGTAGGEECTVVQGARVIPVVQTEDVVDGNDVLRIKRLAELEHPRKKQMDDYAHLVLGTEPAQTGE
jgi:poly-gamma-glutamate synthesis protein (capsule biosynthesis protein)